jgi:hypothetical protein
LNQKSFGSKTGFGRLFLVVMPRTGHFLSKFSALFLAALLLAGGCASFDHQWEQAAKQPPPTDDLTGRWQGVWVSESTGHTDQLRALIDHQNDGTYRAQFHAKYHTVLSFGYTVPLKVEKNDGVFKFSGNADLGWMAGGLYQYEGLADATNFSSTYTSKDDHGTFQMSRP